MRLNRGTIILLAVALIVIVGVVVFNNQQANQIDPTPTPGVARVPLFPDATADTVRALEVIDNAAGTSTRVSKDTGGAWGIRATNATDRAPDQAAITTQAGTVAALEGENQFEVAGDQLVNFGLETPAYLLRVTTDATRYTIYIGNTNPTGNRYYVVVTSEAAPTPDSDAEATPEAETTPDAEATPEAGVSVPTGATGMGSLFLSAPPLFETQTLSGTQTVVLVARETINALTVYLSAPPYVPAPTATPTLPPTLNPMSEVEQATATAVFEATQLADMLATITAMAIEVTPEATPDAASQGAAESTPEVTPEATADGETN
jgi:hypothetical protein